MTTKTIDYRNRILLELAETNRFLFSWDNIKGDDNGRLIEVRRGTGKRYINPELSKFYFLMSKFEGIHWIENAKIEKIDGGNTIKLYSGKNSLSFILDDKKTKVNLKIDGCNAIEFVARTENGKLNIYNKDSYTIGELKALTGLGFQTIDNILKKKEVSNFIDIVKKNRIRTKTYTLRDDNFDKFMELVCFIDDLFFDSLMCTNYYKKFEPEFRNRVNEEPENITKSYLSVASYDSSKDIYDNVKDSHYIGLKEIAKEIRDFEKSKEELKLYKSRPSDERTNLAIKIIEAKLKSHEELKLIKPLTSEKPNPLAIKKLSRDAVIQMLKDYPEQPKFDWKLDLNISSSDKKSEIVKDVVAIANAHGTSDGYILYGVDPKDNDPIKGITSPIDDATIQQIVNSKIDRPIDFQYYEQEIDGIRIGVIKINRNQKRPFIVKQDYGVLKKNVILIRRGSSTGAANYDDLQKMYSDANHIEYEHNRVSSETPDKHLITTTTN